MIDWKQFAGGFGCLQKNIMMRTVKERRTIMQGSVIELENLWNHEMDGTQCGKLKCPNNQLDNTLKHLAKVSLMTYLDLKYFDLLIWFWTVSNVYRFSLTALKLGWIFTFLFESYTAHKQLKSLRSVFFSKDSYTILQYACLQCT